MKCLIKNGSIRIGKLQDAVVNEIEKNAYCILSLENGSSVIATIPLSENEISAYKRSPETFFGIYKKQYITEDDPIGLF